MSGSSSSSSRPREVYIDAFRGLMALIMIQGHVFEALLTEIHRADPLYHFQLIFHGSTAPGFLFASGFVAGLPRAPLSWRAGLRRARRLLFVFGVGYWLHLPYFSVWKSLAAPPEHLNAFLVCDALQAIALTQLLVLALQWAAPTRWRWWAGLSAVLVAVAAPWVWAADLGAGLHPLVAPYLDKRTGSHYPLFPFAAFVLAGTLAGAGLGRIDAATRHRRAWRWGLGLLGAGVLLALLLEGRVDFWGASPAYVLVRVGGLVLLLRLVEWYAARWGPGTATLALLGRETLLVFVLHLYLLWGSVHAPEGILQPWAGQLGVLATAGVLTGMLPVLLLAAWVWHRVKQTAPHQAQQGLAFLTVLVVWGFVMRPW